MLDSTARPIKEDVLLPIARYVGNRVHPTTISVISFLFGAGSFAAAVLGRYYLGFGFWVVNRILDGLDGTLARLTGKQSDWGGYVDILLDFIIYSALPIAFVLGMLQPAKGVYVALAFMLAAFYVNAASWMYLSGLIEKRRSRSPGEMTSLQMPRGLIEGTETILIYSLFYFFPALLGYLFAAMGGLVLLGAAIRVFRGYQMLRS